MLYDPASALCRGFTAAVRNFPRSQTDTLRVHVHPAATSLVPAAQFSAWMERRAELTTTREPSRCLRPPSCAISSTLARSNAWRFWRGGFSWWRKCEGCGLGRHTAAPSRRIVLCMRAWFLGEEKELGVALSCNTQKHTPNTQFSGVLRRTAQNTNTYFKVCIARNGFSGTKIHTRRAQLFFRAPKKSHRCSVREVPLRRLDFASSGDLQIVENRTEEKTQRGRSPNTTPRRRTGLGC